MFKRLLEFIKNHPVGIAVTLGLIVAAYIILGNRGSGDAPQGVSYIGPDASAVQAGTQLQMAQISAQRDANIASTQAAVASKQIDVQQIIAGFASQNTLAGINATRDIELGKAELEAETTQSISLLQAQVYENQTAAQTAQATINANAYVAIATAPYNAQYLLAQQENEQLEAQLAASNAQLENLTGKITTLKGVLPTLDWQNNLHLVSNTPQGGAAYVAAVRAL